MSTTTSTSDEAAGVVILAVVGVCLFAVGMWVGWLLRGPPNEPRMGFANRCALPVYVTTTFHPEDEKAVAVCADVNKCWARELTAFECPSAEDSHVLRDK